MISRRAERGGKSWEGPVGVSALSSLGGTSTPNTNTNTNARRRRHGVWGVPNRRRQNSQRSDWGVKGVSPLNKKDSYLPSPLPTARAALGGQGGLPLE